MDKRLWILILLLQIIAWTTFIGKSGCYHPAVAKQEKKENNTPTPPPSDNSNIKVLEQKRIDQIKDSLQHIIDSIGNSNNNIPEKRSDKPEYEEE